MSTLHYRDTVLGVELRVCKCDPWDGDKVMCVQPNA